jgi:hypothetical protein
MLEELEWEILMIIAKRRAGRGYEYKLRWRSRLATVDICFRND